MKGLLIKDFYALLSQAKIFLLLIVFFAFMGNSMYLFAVVYSAILPISALAYDERSKWDTLAAMMPYSVRDIVFSKYVLCYIAVAFSSLLTVLLQYLLAVFKHTPFTADLLVTVIMVACISMLMLAIILPFMFKLGVEKGRMVYMAFIVLIVLVGMGGGTTLVGIMTEMTLPLVGLLLGTLVLTAAGNVLSVLISEKLYKEKNA